MRIVDAPENNITLTPPKNWDAEKHGECESIRASLDESGYTVTLELEPEDMRLLMLGGKIKFKMFGTHGFRPVSFWVAPRQ